MIYHKLVEFWCKYPYMFNMKVSGLFRNEFMCLKLFTTTLVLLLDLKFYVELKYIKI